MKTEPNDPIHAYTETRKYGSEDQFTTEDCYPGITIRQHYAGLAMQGNLAASCSDLNIYKSIVMEAKQQGKTIHQFIAVESIKQADALIEALNTKSDGK